MVGSYDILWLADAIWHGRLGAEKPGRCDPKLTVKDHRPPSAETLREGVKALEEAVKDKGIGKRQRALMFLGMAGLVVVNF